MTRAQTWKLELPTVDDPVVQHALDLIRQWAQPFGGAQQPDFALLLALFFGGQALTVTLATGADTSVAHELNRVPSTVAWARASDGLGGEVYGEPVGGTAANAGPWNRQRVYLRASRAAVYQLVLI